MNLKFQEESIKELQSLAKGNRHSVLIEGQVGCGKSYLAKQYAQMLGVSDFYTVHPTVQSIRDVIDISYNLSNPVMFCIENLDTGVAGSSFTLLKFLEEPAENVYIVVTCRNRYKVPDTIISRSACVSMSSPIGADIKTYAEVRDAAKYMKCSNLLVWKAVKTLKDVDMVYQFTEDQFRYFDELLEIVNFKDTVSNIVWKLGHFNDNSENDPAFVINYIMSTSRSDKVRKYAMNCIRELNSYRIASHAVLAKFVFDCKYGD